jgi:hypothetical protein
MVLWDLIRFWMVIVVIIKNDMLIYLVYIVDLVIMDKFL